MEWARLEILRQEGITDGDGTVVFDHPVAGAGFKSGLGRMILRSADGFYHCSLAEWEGIRGARGVILISGTDW